MKYILDTHALIWLIESSPKISSKIKKEMKNPSNLIFLSSVSLWEIAIKTGLGKLELKMPFIKLLKDLKNTNINILQIENSYLTGLSVLPKIHKDPFDRLIISTAIIENLTIVTADENIRKYGVSCVL